MTKEITLTNEQAINLYNFLQDLKIDKIKNRVRWKFLNVIEEKVFAYENILSEINNELTDLATKNRSAQADTTLAEDLKIKINEKLILFQRGMQKRANDIKKESNTFIFNDREVFEQTKEMLNLVNDDLLVQRHGKIYSEIQDAFLYATDRETPKN